MSAEINPELPAEEMALIERYILDQMSEQESQYFESRLVREPKLKEEVARMRVLLEAVETSVMVEKMEEFHGDLPAAVEKSEGHRPWWRYATAASLTFVAVTIGWLLLKDDPNEQIFHTYFQPDPGLVTPMSSQSEYDFYEGMVAYKSQDYSGAILIWEDLIPNKPQNDTLNFYLGVSHLAQGDEETALRYLRQAQMTADGVFIQEVYYFLGLALIKQGDVEAAKPVLKASGLDESEMVLGALKN